MTHIPLAFDKNVYYSVFLPFQWQVKPLGKLFLQQNTHATTNSCKQNESLINNHEAIIDHALPTYFLSLKDPPLSTQIILDNWTSVMYLRVCQECLLFGFSCISMTANLIEKVSIPVSKESLLSFSIVTICIDFRFLLHHLT